MKKVALFWPGDYRSQPNEWARPQADEATEQLQRAFRKLGRTPYLVPGFLTRPDEAISKLGPIDDPMIGVFVHWAYGPHTCDGVVGRDNPLLLASNFSGVWPGLVALLNTGACLESLNRRFSRIWTSASEWTKDETFMARLDEWCSTGQIRYRTDELHFTAAVSPEAHRIAEEVAAEIRKRRILALMLGDTSMGMINGYFGPRLLAKHGFAEHKVDQAWLPVRMKDVGPERIEAAFRFVREKGITFHWREKDAADFTEESTRTQLQMYLAVLDLLAEFKADCLGWQYQLGLLSVLPPSDFCEGLLNSTCRPESNGDLVITSTEADQGNLIPMELMKRLLLKKGLHQAVMFHDVRWGGEHDGRWLWVLLNSGSCGAYAFNHDPNTLQGVHSYRQPAGYFPIPGGTFAGESLPGKMTWARSYIKNDELSMDVGQGECVALPPKVCDAWWEGTTRQWPFMAADLGCAMETVMAHYMSNHIAVAYGDIFGEMLALSQALGFKVRVLVRNSQLQIGKSWDAWTMDFKPFRALRARRQLPQIRFPRDLARFYEENEGVGLETSPDYPVRIRKLKQLQRVKCPDILVLKEEPRGWKHFAGVRIGIDSFLDDIVYVVNAPCCCSGAIMLFGPDVGGPGGDGEFSIEPSLVVAPSFSEWLRNLERWDWIEYAAVPGSIRELARTDQEFLRQYYHDLNPNISW